jgi:hypothetical protein
VVTGSAFASHSGVTMFPVPLSFPFIAVVVELSDCLPGIEINSLVQSILGLKSAD